MVTAGAGDAFTDAGMLLSDVTVLNGTNPTQEPATVDAATTDNNLGGTKDTDSASTTADPSPNSKKTGGQKWFDRDSQVNAQRRGLKNSVRILRGSGKRCSLATSTLTPRRSISIANG